MELRSRNASVPLGLICDTAAQLGLWRELPVQSVIPHHSLVSQDLIRAVHAAGKKLPVWTVNKREEMLRLKRWGVDAIISDNTELLVRAMKPEGRG